MIAIRKRKGIYVLLIMLVFLFFSSSHHELTNAGQRIWHISGSQSILCLAILSCTFLFTLFFMDLRGDIILVLLVIRVLIMFPTIIICKDQAWGNYLFYYIAIVSYLVCRTMRLTLNDLYPYIKLSLVIMMVQSFYLFISSPVSYSDSLYKYFFVAPMGASNAFATKLAPIALFVIMKERNAREKLFWTVLSFLSLFCTKSRTALFTFIVVGAIYFLKDHKITKKSFFTILTIVIATLLLFMLIRRDITNYLKAFFYGFSDLNSSNIDFDKIFSGRFSMLKEDIICILNHPIAGNGFAYTNARASVHNIVLELLFVGGAAELFVNCLCVVKIQTVAKKFSGNRNDIIILYRILVFIVMEAMFEKVLLTMATDFLFWTFAGCLVSESEQTNEQIDEVKCE